MKPVLVPSLLDQRVNWLIMREVLATLQASEPTLAHLKHLSSSKLSRTVQRLTKHADPTIASVALELVQTWASLALSPWKASAPEVAAAVQCALAGASGSASDPPTAPSSAEGVASSVLRVALVAAPQLAAARMPPHACPTGLARVALGGWLGAGGSGRVALGGWLWAGGSGPVALGGAPHSGGGAAPPRARERQRERERQTDGRDELVITPSRWRSCWASTSGLRRRAPTQRWRSCSLRRMRRRRRSSSSSRLPPPSGARGRSAPRQAAGPPTRATPRHPARTPRTARTPRAPPRPRSRLRRSRLGRSRRRRGCVPCSRTAQASRRCSVRSTRRRARCARAASASRFPTPAPTPTPQP